MFAFFAIVYFLCFAKGLDLFFRQVSVNTLNNILAVVGLVLSLIASVGLAEFTAKRIKEKYRKDQ